MTTSFRKRGRLSGPAMRTFASIADRWGLVTSERSGVFGSPSRFAYRRLELKARNHSLITLTANTLARISVVLSIHRSLRILFERELEAQSWLRAPHQAQPFGGQAPLDLMVCGAFEGLLAVSRFLEAARQGIYMPPNSADPHFRPYSDDEIIIHEPSDSEAPLLNLVSAADVSLIERAFPPADVRPEFDVPRFWSNPRLKDVDTIIALVLDKPTTEDLARTIVSYGPRRVIAIVERLSESGELSSQRAERAKSWLGPLLKGLAMAARDVLGIPPAGPDGDDAAETDADLVEKLKTIATEAEAGETVDVTGLPTKQLSELLFRQEPGCRRDLADDI